MSKQLKILSVLFVTLALSALLVGNNRTTNNEQSQEPALSFSEFDQIITSPIDKISAVELADYLFKQEHHYNLIDLHQNPAAYQIPTSENLSIEMVLNKNIAVNETIFLYSQNETIAIQLYYLLKIRGYFKVKVLTGGLNQWYNDILQPDIGSITKEQLIFRKKLTEYFGGRFGQSELPIEIKNILITKKHKKHHGC